MEIEIRIDSLYLGNMPPVDYQHVGAAMQRELERLIGERGAPVQRSGGSAEIAVDAIQLPPHLGAEGLGIHLAQSIYAAVAAQAGEQG